jgi:hypothetical protein
MGTESTQAKIELLLTARNLAQGEFDKLITNLKDSGTAANKTTTSIQGITKLKEPLMALSAGPLQGLISSFSAILRLAAAIPKVFLGPLAIVIGVLAALENKFHVIAKAIGTVKEVFSSLASFNFEGMGKRISDIWTDAKKKAEEASAAMKDYFDKSAQIAEAQGNTAAAAFDKEVARHQEAMTAIVKAEEEKGKKLYAEREQEATLHKAILTKVAKDAKDASDKEIQDIKDADAKKLAMENEAITAKANLLSEEAARGLQEKQFQDEQEDKADKENWAKMQAASEAKRKLWAEETQEHIRLQEQETAERNRIQDEEYQRAVNLAASMTDALAQASSTAFIALATNARDSTKVAIKAFKEFGNSVLSMIVQLIAKFVILNILKAIFSGATGGIGAFISGFATKGLEGMTMSAVPSGQTSDGDLRQVPGAFNAPMPIIAHGGEILGRPNGGGFGGQTIIVSGDVFGWSESMEKIRKGLYNHTRMTGLPVQV